MEKVSDHIKQSFKADFRDNLTTAVSGIIKDVLTQHYCIYLIINVLSYFKRYYPAKSDFSLFPHFDHDTLKNSHFPLFSKI